MQLHKFVNQRQPDTRTFVGTACGVSYAVKALEHMRQFLFWDPYACIAYLQQGIISLLLKAYSNGTGLGLSLTYDIVVKGHGGKIEVNTKENEFTEFVVTIPLN